MNYWEELRQRKNKVESARVERDNIKFKFIEENINKDESTAICKHCKTKSYVGGSVTVFCNCEEYQKRVVVYKKRKEELDEILQMDGSMIDLTKSGMSPRQLRNSFDNYRVNEKNRSTPKMSPSLTSRIFLLSSPSGSLQKSPMRPASTRHNRPSMAPCG